MAPSSSAFEATEEGRAFLQSRVASAGLVATGLGVFFLLFRSVQQLVSHQLFAFVHPSYLFHVAATAALFCQWLACRRGVRSVAFVHTVEVLCLVATAVAYSGMGYYIPLVARPDYIVLLALGLGLVARAAYVPSSARRTAALGALVAIPALVMTYGTIGSLDLEKWAHVEPTIRSVSKLKFALDTTIFNGAWWVCIIGVTALTSRVIYGLRKEVSDVRKLGQYTLDTKLGEGGMGVVYMAHHAMLRRPTAIKLLPLDKAGERSLVRFEREVQLTSGLTHPNTVTIFDYGRTPEGVFYYAMELLDGATLSDLVAVGGPQPAARVVHLLHQIAGALAEAHGVGLIHRDIKPSNIMVVDQGGVPDVAKVLDFGLVKELADVGGSASLTHADQLTGTPQYLCPEAIRDPESVDGRGDLYALGAVAYFLLTGTHLFEGATVVAVCSDHLHTSPTSPSERLGAPVPSDLEQLLLCCLAKEPADRPASAEQLQHQLEQLSDYGHWTVAQARDWWALHSDAIAGRVGERASEVSDMTMGIELQGRSASGQRG